MDTVTRDKLRQTIEKIERLEIEKKEISEAIRDVLSEAKSTGFDTKAIKEIIKLRKKDPDKREEEELILGTYLAALGELPLFEAENASNRQNTTDSNVVSLRGSE